LDKQNRFGSGYDQMTNTAYDVVAARLRDEILSGKQSPGEQLPSEREMCEHFSVSRITLRHALRLLAEEGLVQRRHGSGNFVAPNPTRRIPVMIDYTGSMRDHAPQLRRKLLRSGWQAVGQAQAAALQIAPETEVLCAERADTLKGQAVAWDRAAIVRPFAEKLEAADLAQVDFLERWMRRSRFRIISCEQMIEAVSATAEMARQLRMRAGRPVLRSTEIYFAETNLPAGVFVSCYHPQQMCIRSQFNWERVKK
jgi:GntR family transcriptional regulator